MEMDKNLDSRAWDAYQQYKTARKEGMTNAAHQAGKAFLETVEEIERQDAEVRANPQAITVHDLGEHISNIYIAESRLAELREQKKEVKSYLDNEGNRESADGGELGQ